MFYDHKKKEILDFIKECYQLTFDTTEKPMSFEVSSSFVVLFFLMNLDIK